MRQFKVPFYSELAVKNIFPKIKEQNQLKLNIPDLSENEFPEREFFNTILGTLFPKELESIIKTSRKNRALNKINDKSELIKMTPEVYSEIVGLLSYPSWQK